MAERLIFHVRQAASFRRDSKRLRKSGADLTKLDAIVKKLAQGKSLEVRHHNHLLIGSWKGYQECHITPDWLLIYRICGDELLLARTGSHSELF